MALAKVRVRGSLKAGLASLAGARRGLDPSQRGVAVTFDDGPDPEFTPRILDALAALGATATFFVVGERARAHPELVRRMVAEGHAVGTHSRTHPDTRSLSWSALVREYRGGYLAAQDVLGRPSRLFRPPTGYINTRGAAAIRATRLRTWLWTIDPRDWVPGVDADSIVRALDRLSAGDVVLLHDGMVNPRSPACLDRSATIDALPAVVALARDRGLVFCALPD